MILKFRQKAQGWYDEQMKGLLGGVMGISGKDNSKEKGYYWSIDSCVKREYLYGTR